MAHTPPRRHDHGCRHPVDARAASSASSRAAIAIGQALCLFATALAMPALAAERTTMVDIADIARRFDVSEPDLAGRIRDPRTTASDIPLPFLKPGQQFVEVITRTEPYPFKFPVLIEGGSATFLANRPDELKRIAKASGFRLDTPAAAVAYVALLLRLEQPYSRRLVILDRFTDVPPLTTPSQEQRARYDALAAKYANVIRSPVVEVRNGVATGTAYAVRRQALERLNFSVHADGRAEIAEEVLEPDLPINMQM